MAISWAGTLILLAVIVFMLGWLTTLIVLLINRKTRTVGIVLSAVSVGFVLLSLILLVGFRVQQVERVGHSPNFNDARRPVVEKNIDIPSSESKKKRPAWIESKPRLVGDVYHMSVMAGPYTTRQECDAKLPEELQKAVNHYAEMCLDGQTAEGVALPVEALRHEIVKEEWEELQESSVGPMTNLYARLEFDRHVKERIMALRHQAEVNRRLFFAAAVVIVVLGCLTGLYAYLKISNRRIE